MVKVFKILYFWQKTMKFVNTLTVTYMYDNVELDCAIHSFIL